MLLGRSSNDAETSEEELDNLVSIFGSDDWPEDHKAYVEHRAMVRAYVEAHLVASDALTQHL